MRGREVFKFGFIGAINPNLSDIRLAACEIPAV